MRIWKEALPTDTGISADIELPFASQEDAIEHILSVGLQLGTPMMWCQADDDADGNIGNKKEFSIRAIGTGHDYSDDRWRNLFNLESYIGTVPSMDGTLVLHYFLIDSDDYRNVFKPRAIKKDLIKPERFRFRIAEGCLI